MTQPVVIDAVVLQTFIEHMRAVADDITELSTARPCAIPLLNSTMEWLDAPNVVSKELERISTAIRDWAQRVHRSQLQFAAAETQHSARFGHR